jgi:hypothetical protein
MSSQDDQKKKEEKPRSFNFRLLLLSLGKKYTKIKISNGKINFSSCHVEIFTPMEMKCEH